jgi:hypothetical protein
MQEEYVDKDHLAMFCNSGMLASLSLLKGPLRLGRGVDRYFIMLKIEFPLGNSET